MYHFLAWQLSASFQKRRPQRIDYITLSSKSPVTALSFEKAKAIISITSCSRLDVCNNWSIPNPVDAH